MEFLDSPTFMWAYIFIVLPALCCLALWLRMAERDRRRKHER